MGGAHPAGRSKYAPPGPRGGIPRDPVQPHAILCNPPRDPSNPHRGFTDSRNPKCDGVTEARGGDLRAALGPHARAAGTRLGNRENVFPFARRGRRVRGSGLGQREEPLGGGCVRRAADRQPLASRFSSPH